MLPQTIPSHGQALGIQQYNHQLSQFPQSYLGGSAIANLGYHYPGYLMQYPSPAMIGRAGYPAGYGPGVNGIIPINNGMYVTSLPGYTTPRASGSLRNSNVGIQGGTIPVNPNIMTTNEIRADNLPTELPANPTTNPTNIQGVPQLAGLGATRIIGGGITNKTALQQLQLSHNTIGLQGFSQIQYIPYQSYYIDYEQRQFVQNVMVPVQKRVTDYYAVEHVVDYVPKQVEETVVEYIPQQKMGHQLFYVPVETKLVHLPHHQQQHRTATATIQRQPITTVTNTQQVVQLPATVVGGQERIISRPVQQVVPRQDLIQGLTNQLQRGSGVRSTSVSPVKVQQTGPVVVPTTIPAPQRPPVNVPAPTTIQGQTGIIGTASTPQVIGGQQILGGRQVVNQVGAPLPPAGSNQFQQSQKYLQNNLAQLQQQMQIPDSAKVAYQYSTRTVRNLSPGEVPRNPTTTVGQPIPGPAQTIGQPVQRQPIQGQTVQGQQPIGQYLGQQGKLQTNQIGQPGPSPATVASGPTGQQVTGLLPMLVNRTLPAGQAPASTGGFPISGPAPNRAQVGPPPAQPSAPTLMQNNKVDLADSEHIDITKSVFNATYGDSSQPTQQLPLRQGSMTGTNAAIYTSGAGQNSNTFSFGNNSSSIVQPYDSIAGNTNVNRSSGNFGAVSNQGKLSDAQANRISGGSVYDYDQLRDY